MLVALGGHCSSILLDLQDLPKACAFKRLMRERKSSASGMKLTSLMVSWLGLLQTCSRVDLVYIKYSSIYCSHSLNVFEL